MIISMNDPVVLKADHITKKYDNRTIINDISIVLHGSELVCLLGVSGIGKSTLFSILSGLSMPNSGRVLLHGNDITGKPGSISYMQQKDLMLPYKTIVDNVSLPLQIRGERKKAAREKAAALFPQFGLEGTEKKYPVQLSGGMRQRAALLRTYLFGGTAALLDEPFSALDAITKSAIHNWYLGIMEQIKLSTIFITHDIDEAILISDRIYIMAGSPGRITAEIFIDKPKPRDDNFTVSDDFLVYKRKILDLLK